MLHAPFPRPSVPAGLRASPVPTRPLHQLHPPPQPAPGREGVPGAHSGSLEQGEQQFSTRGRCRRCQHGRPFAVVVIASVRPPPHAKVGPGLPSPLGPLEGSSPPLLPRAAATVDVAGPPHGRRRRHLLESGPPEAVVVAAVADKGLPSLSGLISPHCGQGGPCGLLCRPADQAGPLWPLLPPLPALRLVTRGQGRHRRPQDPSFLVAATPAAKIGLVRGLRRRRGPSFAVVTAAANTSAGRPWPWSPQLRSGLAVCRRCRHHPSQGRPRSAVAVGDIPALFGQ